ncbi:MAG: SDR family oxidoreductase [Candidatus Obscuribacter sp.]|nr:SDR family oxidoreductase [Candidatus Obscuribacter sp.]MBL0184281.1 SDR family oxidoreductase [Candidatus Obscuribacter sp.]MBP7577343.1 SDR family oxidoreductase [Candidatus Obscuribacter sp.]
MNLENRSESSAFSSTLLAQKTALITGAGRGIGLAIAQLFCQCGIKHLILTGRNQSRLETAAKDLSIYKDCQISIEQLDLSVPEAVAGRLDTIKQKLGTVDILINNAGVYQTAQVAGHTLNTWQKILDINLTGSMLLTSAFLPGMLSQNWGRIVNVSSISGKSAEAYGAAYSASKFALLGLTQSTALESARNGVTVNAVCPGWVATDMAFEQIDDPDWQSLNGLPAQDAQEFTRLSVPQERFIEPSEVASLVAYLCTNEARGITGQAINVCGGLSLH